MNRAWIPAGALAGVSVAGLLALGPLTDSMSTSVPFPPPITVANQGTGKPGSSHELRAVSLTINAGAVGDTTTSRGAEATATNPNPNEGFVSVHIHKVTPKNAAPPASRTNTAPKPTKQVKKPVNSARSPISTPGETNDSSGLAGSGSGSTGPGEQSQTPSGDGP